MKPDAVLVNSSRGPIVKEDDLVAHLQANPDFRAGLDVRTNAQKIIRISDSYSILILKWIHTDWV